MSSADLTNAVFDVAIIGAGVVGCAVARRFVLEGARVVIIEKAADVLDGASKANSAILHTGFDAPPGSLEQKCIANGYREYLKIHKQLGLPLLKSSALVLAWDDEQVQKLDGLIAKAHKNGVGDVKQLTHKQICAREPHLSPNVKGGFLVPGEYLIDPWTSAHAYILQALANGAQLLRNAEVLSGNFEGGEWNIETSRGGVRANKIITCAGLYGDVVDERLLGEKSFSIKPRKGQFVVFDKAAAALATSIILPVPSAKTKGIVICRTIFGNLLVGPTAQDQDSRTDASTDKTSLSQLRDRGIEMIPALANCEVTATYAGLRPACEYSDYQIKHDTKRNYVSVGAIRSTGLSAALGIADYVVKLETNKFAAKPIKKSVLPELAHLSDYHSRDWQHSGNEGIVCHCELVTKREIEAALSSPMPPATMQGLKRRTRVTMGRCQGFYCASQLAAITKGRFNDDQ